MKYFLPVTIEYYVKQIISDDKEASRIMESWSIEKDEVVDIIVEQFKKLGIFKVHALKHSQLIYKNIIFQLNYCPQLIERLNKIREEIARAKARSSRRS